MPSSHIRRIAAFIMDRLVPEVLRAMMACTPMFRGLRQQRHQRTATTALGQLEVVDDDVGQPALPPPHLRDVPRFFAGSAVFDLQRPMEHRDGRYPVTVARGSTMTASASVVRISMSRSDASRTRRIIRRTPVPARLDWFDRNEFVQSGQVLGITRVYGRAVGMRGGCDQQVHHPAAWLAPDLRDSIGQLRVAVGDCIVDGQRVKAALDSAETIQPKGAILRGFRDKHTELQFGETGDADGQFAGNGSNASGN